MIMGRYETRTAQPKITYSRNVVTKRQAKRVEDMDAILLSWDRKIKGHEHLAGKPLGEALLVIALTEAGVRGLQSKAQLSSKEVSCREVRYVLVAYIERLRDSSIGKNRKKKALTTPQSSARAEAPPTPTSWTRELGQACKSSMVKKRAVHP